MRKWRIEDSNELYGISGWGVNYFRINDKGNVAVTPRKDGVEVDLKEVMDDLALRDVSAPVLVRFPDIIDNRIEKTSTCFKKAANEYGYNGENFIIYPIKVNQISPVVEEVMKHGQKFNLGLEAGSKPELHAVLAVNMNSDSLIICNGYKDQDYIELALLAQKMGKRIFIVVEKFNELEIITRIAKKLGVRPNIGIRIKLAASGSGKWEESGGDASKFGLTSGELLAALQYIEENGMKECLKLIHFHIGSQITKIRRIQNALREASMFYVQLHKMGYGVQFVDCGGGLGVDYDGSRSSNSESSVNYSIQEYVNNCVYTFVEAANANEIRIPTSSPRVDVRWRLTIRCSSWRCWRPLRCLPCPTSLWWTRKTMLWQRNCMRYGATSMCATCWRTGTMHSKSVRRPSTSSRMACWTCAPVRRLKGCIGRWHVKSTRWCIR